MSWYRQIVPRKYNMPTAYYQDETKPFSKTAAARILGVHRVTVDRMLKDGRLPGTSARDLIRYSLRNQLAFLTQE